jgi:hypothetical protein
MGSSAASSGVPAPAQDPNQLLAAILQGVQGAGGLGSAGGSPSAPQQGTGQAGGGSAAQDPWLQAQQQAHDAANAQWGQLGSPGASPYQVGSSGAPQQNPGGGYNSGEDWVKAQAAAQADSDKRYGKAPGVNYMGQTGPYGAVGDLAPNQYVARADQWAMNGSGPAIAPAIQQAINEDPRLSDLYANQPIQRINNVGNGFGVLPGALTPGVALHNAGQIPDAYNELLKYSAQNPGKPMGMNNLGPAVAQQAALHALPGQTTGVNRDPGGPDISFYDYSSPNGSTANSAGANAQRADVLQKNPQLQMLLQMLMGGQQSGGASPASGGQHSTGAPLAPTYMAPQSMAPGGQQAGGANPLLGRSQTSLNALQSYR